MNDEQFEKAINKIWLFSPSMADQLRARNTAQREALARVEAELEAKTGAHRILENGFHGLKGDLKAVQAQLAEAVGLLRQIDGGEPLLDCSTAKALEASLARTAQAEQQEAQSPMAKIAEGLRQKAADEWANHPSNPANEEAQGAQAGEFQREDRYIVIKRKDLEAVVTDREWFKNALSLLELYLPKREYLVIESDWPEYEPTWAAIQARNEGRAALATQPAAAHGDEAVRKDAERLDFILTKARKVVVDCISSGRFDVYVEEGIMGDVAYPGVRREFTPGVGSTQELAVMREAIDAAMRAQGDGEVE